ncbi:hypothetical protein F0P96_00015 [Hymenobacter busanensis]|uniref:Uncharacterized protein n=1 Tax=Hymenobacter busanensis TaxID=2607656 RepID=A0A7L4ZVW5_9BACT|nr:hypothetical protein [Hymenobacter busanensis]KAA9339060.1 hypothetical protein F0P96_00015 [Hymenobacter busanensis]QHJ07177.1 hypothetical protein GUY19_07730 [Hymenobacter busanensis]
MSDEYIAGLIGTALGAAIGTATSYITSYWAPLRLERRREKREEERLWGPRKRLIREMLDNAAPGKGRSFKTLKLVTGTNDDELSRLLVELGARGFTRESGEVAWDYAENRPLGKYT